MPSDKKVSRNGFDCTFSEETHTYVIGDTANPFSRLISCTTLVHQFVPPFDKVSVARRVALKTGANPDDIVAEWDKAGKDSCEFGTRVHEICEDALLGKPPRNKARNEEERAVMKIAWDKAKKIQESSSAILGVELMVFSPSLRIAGTIDLIVKDKDGNVWILDWKTNKEIDKPAFRGERMLPPVQTLENSTINRYALQLSIYQLVLLAEGYLSPADRINRALIHLGPSQAKIIPVPFLIQEAALAALSVASTSWGREAEKLMPF